MHIASYTCSEPFDIDSVGPLDAATFSRTELPSADQISEEQCRQKLTNSSKKG